MGMSGTYQEYIDQQPHHFYVLRLHSQNCWPVMAGLMNTLDKHGYPICMEDNILFVSDPPPGVVARVLHLGYINEVGENMPGLIGRYREIGIILL